MAGPIADAMSSIITGVLLFVFLKQLKVIEENKKLNNIINQN